MFGITLNSYRICDFRAPIRHILGTQIDTIPTLIAHESPLGSATNFFSIWKTLVNQMHTIAAPIAS